ncbi:junctophilin-2 isoform 2, partial [Daubentonia madagascariensis]
GC